LKYKQVKFSLLDKSSIINLKLKKITFLNILKKKLFNSFNIQISFFNITNNNYKKFLSLFKLFKQFNLILLNNNKNINNNKNKFSLLLNILFNGQLLNNKINNVTYLKNYENSINYYEKVNINNYEKKLIKFNYSNNLKEILNIKMQLFSILFFSKVLTYNLKLLLNNNYLKLLITLINNSSKQNLSKFLIDKHKIENNKNFETLYLFFIYKTILLNNKKNLNDFTKFIEKNKKIEFVLKDLFKNYF